MESVAHVGMDVDKEKIAMAVVCGFESEPRLHRIVKNTPSAIEEFFGELQSRFATVISCYEAGACGFELYRRITELGVACAVVAPTSVPKKTNDRIKTDRRDAKKLAVEMRNGNLSPVYVPSRKDEAIRDYLRLYEDAKMDLRKAKQRLIHFLNRHEVHYEGGRSWTERFWKWLRSLEFDSPYSQETLEEYMAEVVHLEQRCRRSADRIEEIAVQPEYEKSVQKLKAFRGIGTLTALSLVLEIGDFRRFSRAEQFMAFLGLVPSERSSGNKRRLGGITKAGNSHLRKLLIEAAWHAPRFTAASKQVARDREGLPADVVNYCERADRRLQKKYRRLFHLGRPPQIAATAVARELAGFIWGAMVGQTA